MDVQPVVRADHGNHFLSVPLPTHRLGWLLAGDLREDRHHASPVTGPRLPGADFLVTHGHLPFFMGHGKAFARGGLIPKSMAVKFRFPVWVPVSGVEILTTPPTSLLMPK